MPINHTSSVPLSHIKITQEDSDYTAPCGCAFHSHLMTPEDDGTEWVGYDVTVVPCFDPQNIAVDNVAAYTSDAPNLTEAKKGIQRWLKHWTDAEIAQALAWRHSWVEEMRGRGYKIADDGSYMP